MGKYTGEDLIRAIELNGYRQARYAFLKNSHGVTTACAIGQGVLNTGLDVNTFLGLLEEVGINAHKIMMMNDSLKMPISEIAAELRRMYPDAANRVAVSSKAPKGSTRAGYQGIKVLPRNGDFLQVQSVGYHNKRDAYGRFTR